MDLNSWVTIISPIVAAVFYLAWNHPKDYYKVSWILAGINFVAFIGLAFWNAGVTHSLRKVEGVISSEAISSIKSLLFLSNGYDAIVIMVAINLFLFSLQFLPFLKDSPEKETYFLS